MLITNINNPRYTKSQVGVLLTVTLPGREGPVDFCALPTDVTSYGRELYQRAVAGEFGPIAPYTEPTSTKEQMIPLARDIRDAAENSDIAVFGVLWQVDAVARDRMRSTIETAAATNTPPETTVDWILSNNTLRASTAAELQQVLVAYTMRLDAIFRQYITWRDDPAVTTMFSYVE